MSRLENVLSSVDMKRIGQGVLQRNPLLRDHHVAIVFSEKSGNVLAKGTNYVVGISPIHAEVDALNNLRRRIRANMVDSSELRKGVGVTSLRIARCGELRDAKPCVFCAQKLQACLLVRSVTWSDSDGTLVCHRV